jgi:hypothetical protein
MIRGCRQVKPPNPKRFRGPFRPIKAERSCEPVGFRYMHRLYPLVLEHRLPAVVRYCISTCIMVVCSVLQMGLQMQTGSSGYFLLLPGVFLSGLIFDRGSGIFAAGAARVQKCGALLGNHI